MADTVNFRVEVQGTVGSTTFTAGNRNTAIPLVLSSDILQDQTFDMAQNDIVTLFINSGFPTTFGAIVIIADGSDVFCEEVCDEDGTLGARPFCRKLRDLLPYIIPTNVAKANYTVNFGGGTNDTIERKRIVTRGEDYRSEVILFCPCFSFRGF